jgi:uncharacterized protein YqeY
MSELAERLEADMKQALRAGEKTTLAAIRRARAGLLEALKRPDAPPELDEAAETAVLQRIVKQHKESIEQFEQGGRSELAEKERAEMSVIECYLPAELGDDEIEAVVREVIASEGASEPRDIGKVMKPAMAQLKGQADGGRVRAIAARLLEDGSA